MVLLRRCPLPSMPGRHLRRLAEQGLVTPGHKKNAAGLPRRLEPNRRLDYLETDFLNMRSIFSLIASIAVEFACAVDNA
jgi:hypothetical protein